MAGTKAGGIKARDKNYELYGKDFYKIRGAEGGKAGTKAKGSVKGFAADPFRARTAGAKGGKISRRGKVVK